MPPFQQILKTVDSSSSSITSTTSNTSSSSSDDVISSILQHFRPLRKAATTTMVAPKKTKKKRKTVDFAKQVQVYCHITREELTEDEKNQMWYSREALTQLQQENSHIVHNMMHPHRRPYHTRSRTNEREQDNERETCCFRGLEYRTGMGARLRKENRVYALQAVLSYQYRQWESSSPIDRRLLAHIYQDYTRHSTRMAQRAGRQDHQEVLEFESLHEAAGRVVALPTTTATTKTTGNKRKPDVPDHLQSRGITNPKRLHRPPRLASSSPTTTTSPPRITVAA